MAIDHSQLKSELQNDPDALGYLSLTAENDEENVAIINADSTAYQQWRRIEGRQVVGNTVPSEWAALSTQEKERYSMLTGASGGVDATEQHVRGAFAAMFSSTTVTRSNLVGVAQRLGSRAENLFGPGTVVRTPDVSKARQL